VGASRVLTMILVVLAARGVAIGIGKLHQAVCKLDISYKRLEVVLMTWYYSRLSRLIVHLEKLFTSSIEHFAKLSVMPRMRMGMENESDDYIRWAYHAKH